MSDTDVPDDLIPIAQAAKLVPSPRPGRGTNLSTVYRWCNAGRLRHWRQGRWRFVSRAEVLGLLRPAGPARTRLPSCSTTARNREEEARAAAWAQRILDEAGI